MKATATQGDSGAATATTLRPRNAVEWMCCSCVHPPAVRATGWPDTRVSQISNCELAKGVMAMAMYPEDLLRPMREELRGIGFRELRTAAEVDAALREEKRSALVVVNSVCGCAAGRARPAIAWAVSRTPRPELLYTVFAGQDAEATEQARGYFTGYGPSSPSITLMQDGKVVFMLERRNIEGRDPSAIAADLTQAFERFCAPTAAGASK